MKGCPEYHGDQEYFMTIGELENQYPKIASFINGFSAHYEGGPETVNMAYDPRCNLSCPSCNRNELPKFPEDIEEKFSSGIRLIGQEIKNLYMVGMGDPFGTRHYLEFLKNLNPSDYPKLDCIILNTNGIKVTPDIWYSIPERVRKYRSFIMTVSMDGARRNSFEINRYPAKWDEFLERLRFISELRKSREIVQFRIYFVYQPNNYEEMPELVDLAKEFCVDEIFFARLRDWKGLGDEYIKKLDLTSLDHPLHDAFEKVVSHTKSLASNSLKITVMS